VASSRRSRTIADRSLAGGGTHLSHCLGCVSESILVLDRVIARIEPASGGDGARIEPGGGGHGAGAPNDSDSIDALERRGIRRRSARGLPRDGWRHAPS
jgi:hypothetical protein